MGEGDTRKRWRGDTQRQGAICRRERIEALVVRQQVRVQAEVLYRSDQCPPGLGSLLLVISPKESLLDNKRTESEQMLLWSEGNGVLRLSGVSFLKIQPNLPRHTGMVGAVALHTVGTYRKLRVRLEERLARAFHFWSPAVGGFPEALRDLGCLGRDAGKTLARPGPA